jgi:3-hydroxybutyryl-CoA dehydratase
LPGRVIYISQNLVQSRCASVTPSRLGHVTAVDQERARITVSTVCHVGETQVIVGEAMLMVPRRASLAQAAE